MDGAGENVMDLVYDQHPRANRTQQPNHLHLPFSGRPAWLVKSRQSFKNVGVEASFLRDGRSLNQKHRHNDVLAGRIVGGGVLVPHNGLKGDRRNYLGAATEVFFN
jgi:hypothetical protein